MERYGEVQVSRGRSYIRDQRRNYRNTNWRMYWKSYGSNSRRSSEYDLASTLLI